MSSFADELVASPIGAVLLDVLEKEQDPYLPSHQPVTPDDARIAEAADHVSAMSFAAFLEAAFRASSRVGPWVPDGPDSAFDAYRHVGQRRSIAEAIDEVFGERLQAPVDLDAQEWWVGDAASLKDRIGPAFGNLTRTYGSGEFPWEAIRTVTAPPAQIHGDFVGEQELSGGVGRWSLPVDRDAVEQHPVFTVHRPDDWADLVERHPMRATPGQGCWGLPGNQSALRSRHPLFSLAHQHASIRRHGGHFVPDWTSVAAEYSGVHLSWGGWITSEGFARVDDNNIVTMVRYWFSDRTFWLRDVFGDPMRLSEPHMNHRRLSSERDEREMLHRILGR